MPGTPTVPALVSTPPLLTMTWPVTAPEASCSVALFPLVSSTVVEALTRPLPVASIVPPATAAAWRPGLSPVTRVMPVPSWMRRAAPAMAPDSVRSRAPRTVSLPGRLTALASTMPSAVGSMAPPPPIRFAAPKAVAALNWTRPPENLKSAVAGVAAPLSAQVPPVTATCWKLRYLSIASAPAPVAVASPPSAAFCRRSVLLPAAPPSTKPVGAKARSMPVTASCGAPALSPMSTTEPVTAAKVLLTPPPIDRLPCSVPALTKVLPAPPSKPMRPTTMPVLVLVKLITPLP
jgi:hypothetical protein